MAIFSDRPAPASSRRYSPQYDAHHLCDAGLVPPPKHSAHTAMDPDPRQRNGRVAGLDEAWRYQQQPNLQKHHYEHSPVHISMPRNGVVPPPAPNPPRVRHDAGYEQAVRRSPQQRVVSNPAGVYRSGYPSPASLPSHSRSYSGPGSRPSSSHASDGPPLAPPPPLSFLSHVRNQRRRSSNTRDGQPKVLSRRSKLWPPEGYHKRDGLTLKEAEKLITRGASTFTGYAHNIKHAPEGHFRFFAVMDEESGTRTDRATFDHASFESITLSMHGAPSSRFPWMSLEQPSMAFAFGKSPGTTTLTYYIGKSGSLQPPVAFGSKVKPRKMKLINILERLRDLQMQGLQDEENFVQTYHFLYEKLIEDPDREDSPHYERALQIADLITVLSNPDWIDFSLPRYQVVAKFFDSHDEKIRRRFFHQLLLATELYLRIEAPVHEERAKALLLEQIPPKVAWDLALARRWLEHMSIERMALSETQSTFSFTLMSKRQQKEALWHFAQLLKWPNLGELNYILEEKDAYEKSIEDRSADALSWFTGVVLPGPTLPWLLMNTLIDCDRDTGDELTTLTHIHPNSGFQYRANTYWSTQCIVGKVLGASRGVRQAAGWIGPCYYTPELERAQCVVVRQLEPLDRLLTSYDVNSMHERTAPLGPDADKYPVGDYDLIVPNTNVVEDIIRIQKLSFNPRIPNNPNRVVSQSCDECRSGSKVFDAAIVFAFAEKSLPIRLRYNVDFVMAFPCAYGPHPLYHEYKHRIIRVDDGLAELTNWPARNGLSRTSARASRSRKVSPTVEGDDANDRLLVSRADMALSLNQPEPRIGDDSSSTSTPSDENGLVREVLVIEAFGVSDNEVFARAWCAQYGVGAVIANVRETCVACAVREAFAAGLTVTILTEGGSEKEEDRVTM
ncbi:uncharacterized protein PV09_09735 [Verruconis gallopava]|uniref:Uncharacterized protein n=1 Tax=Verruconis gallopava TaxID=253628 RepID=A0A0D1ZVE0_9PEZI|nr:uncharacterized protein PV09_09735 [Verruconis gallopava]KIV98447.1 hypothetical protein PV09_09735 [Verruconis gallopava]